MSKFCGMFSPKSSPKKKKKYQNGKKLSDLSQEKIMYIEEDKNNHIKHNGRYDAKGEDFSNPSSPSKGNRSYRKYSFDN